MKLHSVVKYLPIYYSYNHIIQINYDMVRKKFLNLQNIIRLALHEISIL